MNETAKMALASLGVNKLRSFLTMSGITIGVFSVIGVMTAVSALRGSIETGLSFLGSNMFQFAKYPTGITVDGNDRHKYESRRNITLPQARRYMELMRGTADVICLKAIENSKIVQATYQNKKTTPDINFLGTNEYFLTSNQFSIATGRNFTGADIDLMRPVCIIGQDIVAKLFPSENPLGKWVSANGRAYQVIGTFAVKGSSFGESQDNYFTIPVTRFLMENGADNYTINIATQAPSQELYNDTMDKGIGAMRIARGLRPEQENDFELYSNDSLVAAFAKIADVVSAGAFIISAIALLAAGVGIMNIMLVSVTERTREIGIRKAIGARKVLILTQFLLESVVLSVTGGLFGILLGTLAGDALALWLHVSVVFPWGWAITGVVVCSGIGIVFGMYPAWKAASLDPIEALRFE
ncbi:MAG TPA: ABC transporter permease [Opitutaceae bacterium]|jgi:putative ABC transport system permease protein